MKTFKDIIAWQKGYELTLAIYRESKLFPRDEEFGLKSQMRRAAASIIFNIAEGFKRHRPDDRNRFYNFASASLEELKCQTMLAKDLGYFSGPLFERLFAEEDEVSRILYGWMQSQQKPHHT